MDDDDIDAALAHEQELEAQRWQEELTNDPGYFDWLRQLVNEVNGHGYHCD